MKLTTEFTASPLYHWGLGIELFRQRYLSGFDIWVTVLCFQLIIEVRV